MANDRESSKQRRARENRARREALAARSTAATTPRPSRAAPAASTRAKGAKGPRRDEPVAEAKGTTTGRGGRTRAERPGDRPVDVDSLQGSFLGKLAQVPGGSQVISGVLVTALSTVFSIVLAIFVHSEDSTGRKVGDKGFTADQTLFEARPLLALLPPLVIFGVVLVGLAQSLGPKRRRAWIITSVFVGALVILQVTPFLYLFTAGMFGYAAYKANKVEGPNELALAGVFSRRRKADDAVETTGADVTDD